MAASGRNRDPPAMSCQICGEEGKPYRRIIMCESCQRFSQRNISAEISKYDCLVGRTIAQEQVLCDLSVDRSCSRCRLETIRYFIPMEQANPPEPTPPPIDQAKKLVKTVDDLDGKLTIRLRRHRPRLPNGLPADYNLPLEPRHFEIVQTEGVLRKVMNATKEFVSATYAYIYTYEYFGENRGIIPSQDEELWKLIGRSVEDIVKGIIPFARELAGSVAETPADMCRLIDSSYWLMYCVQSAKIAKTDVVKAYDELFLNMSIMWPELKSMMELARQIIDIINIWNPSPTEFAFLMALIFCRSLRQNEIAVRKSLSPNTVVVLRDLDRDISNAARSLMKSWSIGDIRWKQLESIVEVLTLEQEVRFDALKPLKQRNPNLVRTLVKPVCIVACQSFATAWNISSHFDLATWPPRYGAPAKTHVDEMVDCVLAQF